MILPHIFVGAALAIGGAAYALRAVTRLGPLLKNIHPERRLDRTFGFLPGMNREEALKILGVSPNTSPEEIEKKYRRLMALNHPDKGGSTYVASKINEARDFLLNKKT
jgi:DnaJ family protein C protein 19